MTSSDLREEVRARYAAAARSVTATGADGCCAPATEAIEVDGRFGAARYDAEAGAQLPAEAVLASLGCGNPLAVADLRPRGARAGPGVRRRDRRAAVARRVGASGFAYGVDMTAEMLELARANAARAGVTNVELLAGTIEELPLPDAAVDVVISNCVVNLSTDKPGVLAETFRVLAPGGRIGISDVVAEDHVTPDERARRGSYVGCIAGALSRGEDLAGLAAAGFVDATVTFTHAVADGLHGAVVAATKPAATEPADPAP